MGQAEIEVFIIFVSLILLAFICAIVVFIFQYYKRKRNFEREMMILNEQHKQELLQTTMEIQQQTMQHIGRELHDNVGQKLILASLHANQMSHEPDYPNTAERITDVAAILNESLAIVRGLSKTLINAHEIAEFSNLEDLVRHECEQVNRLELCNVECRFDFSGKDIPLIVKNFILRTIQEFLQNSIKHAGCTKICLNFTMSADGLHLLASDDGIGFNLDEYLLKTDKGIGLLNMKKRSEIIGAVYSLKSQPGKGTAIELFIPADKLNLP